jgi:putative ABC transport system ATP-binding protein
MIRFENITVREKDFTILYDVSFIINEREKIAFCGKSGSGKTTILTTILGAHIPVNGSVWLAGEKITSKNISRLRQSVSFIGQEPILGAEKVIDAILLPFTYRANRKKNPSHEKIISSIEKLHLSPSILSKETSVISGGEKQRVAIARELLQDKKIFIVDEITSALDPESKNVVLDMFNNNDYTVVSASHDPDWLNICSRVVKVDDGRIVAVSDPRES